MIFGVLGSALSIVGVFFAASLAPLIVTFSIVQFFMTIAGDVTMPGHALVDWRIDGLMWAVVGGCAAAPFNGLVADLVSASQRGAVRYASSAPILGACVCSG